MTSVILLRRRRLRLRKIAANRAAASANRRRIMRRRILTTLISIADVLLRKMIASVIRTDRTATASAKSACCSIARTDGKNVSGIIFRIAEYTVT